MLYTPHDGMKPVEEEAIMSSEAVRTEIKVVGKSGQISLGKSYAGKTLQVQRRADGSILLTAVVVVPESQLWTLEEPHRTAIAEGLAWAAKTPVAATDVDEFIERIDKLRSERSRGKSR